MENQAGKVVGCTLIHNVVKGLWSIHKGSVYIKIVGYHQSSLDTVYTCIYNIIFTSVHDKLL